MIFEDGKLKLEASDLGIVAPIIKAQGYEKGFADGAMRTMRSLAGVSDENMAKAAIELGRSIHAVWNDVERIAREQCPDLPEDFFNEISLNIDNGCFVPDDEEAE